MWRGEKKNEKQNRKETEKPQPVFGHEVYISVVLLSLTGKSEP